MPDAPETIEEVRDKMFEQIAVGWKGHGFNVNYYIAFDTKSIPQLIPAFNLLLSQGLIKQHGAGYSCMLTALGQQEARTLLGHE